MKRALVLSGGGSRGAYECGAWQALRELNVRLDGVYGTSIGALNAALVAQDDFEAALDLWNNISIRQIVAVDEDEDFSVDTMLSRKRDIIPFLLENAHNFKMDVSPLVKLIDEKLDEGRVRASGMQLGMMLTRMPQFSGRAVRLNEIPQGQLADYLLASASCFPIFPMKEIDGEKYMDGGFADNMPIAMAIEDGAEEIVAVDIHPQPVHPEYGCMPFLKQIHPLHDLGGFMDFNPQLLRRSRLMGYYDTMKAYGRFDGIRYTFTRVNELKISEAARRYTREIALFDAGCDARDGDAVLIGALGAETPLRVLSWKDALLRGLELCAQAMGFREDAIYDMDVLTGRILNYAKNLDGDGALWDRSMNEAARAGGRVLTAWIFLSMLREKDFLARNRHRLADFPMETAAALYLKCMDETM